MAHYKTMFDAGANGDYMFAADLDGKEFTLEIEQVSVGELTGENNRKTRKPALKFKRAKKRLAINKTNGKTIAKMYGTDTDGWIGKLITIFPTTTTFGNDVVECIRVRPTVPVIASVTAPAKPADAVTAPQIAAAPIGPPPAPADDMTPEEIAEALRLESEANHG